VVGNGGGSNLSTDCEFAELNLHFKFSAQKLDDRVCLEIHL
jgi:hypothetical protein